MRLTDMELPLLRETLSAALASLFLLAPSGLARAPKNWEEITWRIWHGPDRLAVVVADHVTYGIDYHWASSRFVLLREPEGAPAFEDLEQIKRFPGDVEPLARERGAGILASGGAARIVEDVAFTGRGGYVLVESSSSFEDAIGWWLGADGKTRPTTLGEAARLVLNEEDLAGLGRDLAVWSHTGPKTWTAGCCTSRSGDEILLLGRFEGWPLPVVIDGSGAVTRKLGFEEALDALALCGSAFACEVEAWAVRAPETHELLRAAAAPILRDAGRPVGVRTELLRHALSFEGVPSDAFQWAMESAARKHDHICDVVLPAGATNIPPDWIDSIVPPLLDRIPKMPYSHVAAFGAVLRRASPTVLRDAMDQLAAKGLGERPWRVFAAVQDTHVPPVTGTNWDMAREHMAAWDKARAGSWDEAAALLAVPRPWPADAHLQWSPLLPLFGSLTAKPGDPGRARITEQVVFALSQPDELLVGCSPAWIEWLRLAWSAR